MKYLPLALAVLLPLLPTALPAVTLEVTDDTFAVGAGKLIPSYGALGNLAVSSVRTSYIRFDAAASAPSIGAAEVLSARLTIYFPLVVKAGDLSLYLVTSDWTESPKNYTTPQPSVAATPFATIPASSVISRQFVSIDITAQVKGWLASPGADFGIAIKAAGQTATLIGAKEGPGSGYPATLEINTGLSTSSTVSGSQLADGSVSGAKLVPGTITDTQLGNGSVGSSQLASGLTLGGVTTLGAGLDLPATTTAGAGVITQGGTRLLSTYGTDNFFAGLGAGNLSLTGTGNTATGKGSLSADTAGNFNAAFGTGALAQNTSGTNNSAFGYFSLYNNVGVNNNSAFGYEALYSNTTGTPNTAFGAFALTANTVGTFNTAVGYTALASNVGGICNTALGSAALQTNAGGTGNVAVGYGALASDVSGSDNTALGANTLKSSTAGGNTALGSSALTSATTADTNVAVGLLSLATNVSGNDNVAIGGLAMQADVTGRNNTAVGRDALRSNLAGNFNVALGNSALSADTGNQNTAVGTTALGSNTSGTNNIGLGASAGFALTTGSNNIDIGNAGVAGESATIRIGDASNQTATFIAGINSKTSSGGAAVFINANGQLGTQTSSRRFKDEIEDMGKSSEALLSLRPVTFRYKPEIDPHTVPQWGLIAEEVGAINPDLVVRDGNGEIQTVRYEQVNAMLLNEFLKDHRRLEELTTMRDEEVKELHDENAALKKRLAMLESAVAKIAAKADAGQAKTKVVAARH